MKITSKVKAKSTLIVLLGVLFLIIDCPICQAENTSKELPNNFDADFRFNNEYGLKGKIAFSTKIENLDRILVLDLDNKRIDKLISNASNNSFPAWSPDGDKIAFTSDRDGNKEIYIAEADGSHAQRITTNNVSDDNANWSPDGKTIVYYSGVDKGAKDLETNLFLYDIATKKHTQLTNLKSKNSLPEFSKDGKLITYTTNRAWPGWDICVFDLLKHNDSCPLSGTTTYSRSSFSNDGKSLAYSAAIEGAIGGYIYDFESKSSRKINDQAGNQYDLKWDRTGQFIVYASDAEKKNNYNIYVANLKDEVLSLLLYAPYSLRYLSWHQDPAK